MFIVHNSDVRTSFLSALLRISESGCAGVLPEFLASFVEQ